MLHIKKNKSISLLSALLLKGDFLRERRFVKVALFTLFLLFTQNYVFSQSDKVVTGKVIDAEGLPLPGATILEKGTSNGTVSDVDGNFNIELQSSDPVLSVSFIGFTSKEITVNGQNNIVFELIEDAAQLSEVVVIGYGTTTKKEVTGAVASVDSEEFNKGDVVNPLSLVRGKVPGLTVTNSNGGDPNGGVQVRLRGLNSLSGGQSPLIIVDGVIWTNSIELINPNEIESIDILKDGAAAAIYGTRATNGVILITTKKGVPGEKVAFEFSTFSSVQVASEDNRYLTAEEYRNTIQEFYPELEVALDGGENTNAFNAVTRSPISQYYSMSASGGSENLSFRSNIYVKDNQGLVRNSGATIITPSLSLNQKAFDNKLNLNYKLTYSNINRNRSANDGAVSAAVARNPTLPLFNPDDVVNGGYFTEGGTAPNNPVAVINERTQDDVDNFITGDFNGSFEIIPGLKLRARFSYNSRFSNTGIYRTRFFPNLGSDGEATVSTSSNKNILFEPDMLYEVDFGRHSITALAGYSFFENTNEGFSFTNFNFDVDDFSYNNIGSGLALLEGLATAGSFKNDNRLIGFYGRVSYNYNEKYLLSGSMRYEGSSRFGRNNKWALFPAISAGWRINKEDFADGLTWLNELKLRAGYGVTGNQDIPNYLSLERLGVGGRPFYYNGELVNAFQPTSNPNPDLKWERKGEFNIGLDFSVIDNRIFGNLELYQRNITDLLWFYNVPVPPNVFDNIYANVGELENKGIEAMVSVEIIRGEEFNWITSLNYSRNTNKLIKFSDPSRGYELESLETTPAAGTWSQLILEGQPIGNWVAPVRIGIDDEGNAIYEDVNGDGEVNTGTAEDRRIVGNQYPDFSFGWNNTLKYKNFDLNIFLRGSFGQDALNYERLFRENWTPFLSGTNILRSHLDNPSYTGIQQYDSRHVEDASYIKLDNLTLGYNLTLGKNRSLRFYLTGQNLFIITDYSGPDPEFAIPENFNTQTGASGNGNLTYYPYARSYVAGLNFNF
jgi:TonB-linked SusC/RagA family outer membrane protein